MPPSLTDRVASQLVKTVANRLQSASVHYDKRGNLSAEPLRAAIAQLASQAAKQGLTPSDFDRPEGLDALHAVVAALTLKKPDTMLSYFMPLPDEWKHAVNAAYRLADHIVQQVRK